MTRARSPASHPNLRLEASAFEAEAAGVDPAVFCGFGGRRVWRRRRWRLRRSRRRRAPGEYQRRCDEGQSLVTHAAHVSAPTSRGKIWPLRRRHRFWAVARAPLRLFSLCPRFGGMPRITLITCLFGLAVTSCVPKPTVTAPSSAPASGRSFGPSAYLDYSGRPDFATGGIRMIPIDTPKGTFRVWTKRVGNHPTMKVLLLHGGPGGTHEFFEVFDSFLPRRQHRVLLLRPARIVLQRPAEGRQPMDHRAIRRRSGASPTSPQSRRQ